MHITVGAASSFESDGRQDVRGPIGRWVGVGIADGRPAIWRSSRASRSRRLSPTGTARRRRRTSVTGPIRCAHTRRAVSCNPTSGTAPSSLLWRILEVRLSRVASHVEAILVPPRVARPRQSGLAAVGQIVVAADSQGLRRRLRRPWSSGRPSRSFRGRRAPSTR